MDTLAARYHDPALHHPLMQPRQLSPWRRDRRKCGNGARRRSTFDAATASIAVENGQLFGPVTILCPPVVPGHETKADITTRTNHQRTNDRLRKCDDGVGLGELL
jgi:hypothetical protein